MYEYDLSLARVFCKNRYLKKYTTVLTLNNTVIFMQIIMKNEWYIFFFTLSFIWTSLSHFISVQFLFLFLSLIQFLGYIWVTPSIEFQGTAKLLMTFFIYMHQTKDLKIIHEGKWLKKVLSFRGAKSFY